MLCELIVTDDRPHVIATADFYKPAFAEPCRIVADVL